MSRVFSITRNFMEVGEDLYEILKVTPEGFSSIPNDLWKEYLGAEKVFRKENMLYFVKQVEEATIVEDEPEQENTESKAEENT